MSLFFTCMILFQFKHFFVDFPLQTPRMLIEKGMYLRPYGLLHSLLHGVATAMILALVHPGFMVFGLLDAVIHYHVDYVKTRWGEKDNRKPVFWTQLGIDQLVHQLTYLVILGLVFV